MRRTRVLQNKVRCSACYQQREIKREMTIFLRKNQEILSISRILAICQNYLSDHVVYLNKLWLIGPKCTRKYKKCWIFFFHNVLLVTMCALCDISVLFGPSRRERIVPISNACEVCLRSHISPFKKDEKQWVSFIRISVLVLHHADVSI